HAALHGSIEELADSFGTRCGTRGTEAWQCLDHGRLATCRETDQGNPRAGLGLERDLAEDRPTILVAENDPAIGDAPNKSCRPLMRLASPAAFNRLIENFADALGTGCSAGGEAG